MKDYENEFDFEEKDDNELEDEVDKEEINDYEPIGTDKYQKPDNEGDFCAYARKNWRNMEEETKKQFLKDYWTLRLQSAIAKDTLRKDSKEATFKYILEQEEFKKIEKRLLDPQMSNDNVADLLQDYAIYNAINELTRLPYEADHMQGSAKIVLPLTYQNINESIDKYLQKQNIKKAEQKAPGEERNTGNAAVNSTLDRLYTQIKAHDPKMLKWTTSSAEYEAVRSSMKDLREFSKTYSGDLQSNNEKDLEDLDKFFQKLEAVKKSCEDYFKRKERQFRQEPERRDDPGKQSVEQKRIRAVMNTYEKALEMRDMVVKSCKAHKLDKFSDYQTNKAKEFKKFGKESRIMKLFSVQTKREINYKPSENYKEAFAQETKKFDVKYGKKATAAAK